MMHNAPKPPLRMPSGEFEGVFDDLELQEIIENFNPDDPFGSAHIYSDPRPQPSVPMRFDVLQDAQVPMVQHNFPAVSYSPPPSSYSPSPGSYNPTPTSFYPTPLAKDIGATVPHYDVPQNTVYPNVNRFRQYQASLGCSTAGLTEVQMGMQRVEKSHHISVNQTVKDGPPSYRVRVCKTCCRGDSHMELGTYVDQESAILVNDAHEIVNKRYQRLVFLRPDDEPFLHLLQARRYNRHRGEEMWSVVDIISNRANVEKAPSKKKRRAAAEDESEDDVKGYSQAVVQISPNQAVKFSPDEIETVPRNISQRGGLCIVATVASAFDQWYDDFPSQGLRTGDIQPTIHAIIYKMMHGEDLNGSLEHLYAASAMTMLSSFAPAQNQDVRNVLHYMDLLKVHENREVYLSLCDLMEDFVDLTMNDPETLLAALDGYLTKCQFTSWVLMYLNRFPKWGGSSSSTHNVKGVELMTSQLLSRAESLLSVQHRLLVFFSNLLSQLNRYVDAGGLNMLEHLKVCQRAVSRLCSAIAWFSITASQSHLRMFDCTGRIEHLDSGLQILQQARDSNVSQTLDDEFAMETQLLMVLNTKSRSLAEAGHGRNALRLLKHTTSVRDAAILAGHQLGLTDLDRPIENISSVAYLRGSNGDGGLQHECWSMSGRGSIDIERRLLLLTGCVEHHYLQLHFFHEAPPPPPLGLQVRDMMIHYKAGLDDLLAHMNSSGTTLLFASTSRALLCSIKVSRAIASESPATSALAGALASSAMTVLNMCGQFFDYYGHIRDQAEPIVKSFQSLGLPALPPPHLSLIHSTASTHMRQT